LGILLLLTTLLLQVAVLVVLMPVAVVAVVVLVVLELQLESHLLLEPLTLSRLEQVAPEEQPRQSALVVSIQFSEV
jgi:CHASE2 domain-containing sensor protein